jgi:hypothetical protein
MCGGKDEVDVCEEDEEESRCVGLTWFHVTWPNFLGPMKQSKIQLLAGIHTGAYTFV